MYDEADASGNWANLQRTTYTYGTTSIKENVLSEKSFDVSPNPIRNGTMNIQAKDKTLFINKLELYNGQGHLIINQIIDKQSVAKLATDNLPSGLYILKIKTDSGISTQKIMIQL